jgi:hypothetical protein
MKQLKIPSTNMIRASRHPTGRHFSVKYQEIKIKVELPPDFAAKLRSDT